MKDVIPYGTRVKIKHTEIKSHVIAICMRGNIIEYQVSYFVGGEYKTPWVNDFDIEVIEDNGKQVGLVNYSTELSKL